MRILIYSETAEAKEVQAALNEDGHHASLRSSEFFRASELEKADEVFVSEADANHGEILNAYRDAEINAKFIEDFKTSVSASIKEEAEEEKPKRKKK